ncbi:MAG: hypothetical protein RIC55_32665 [Pirellulaceae bacterium]
MPRDARLALCWIATLAALAAHCATAVGQTPARTAEMSSETQYEVKPAAATTGGGTLLLTMIEAQKANEIKFYSSPIGKMLTNMRKPLSFITGGLIQPTSPKAVAQHAANGVASGAANSPSGGAAAKIKADAAAAKQRAANVRFLGTVDCHWYPEAEAALIASLRADRSECVRHEAALALGRGCCCTKKTVEALKICIAGSNRDGNPGENSLRVKMSAFEALQNCLANCAGGLDASPPPALRPEYPAAPLAPQESAGNADATTEAHVLPDYYRQVESRPWSSVVGEAQQLVARIDARPMPSLNGYGTGRRNLYALWMQSSRPSEQLAPSLAPQPTPAFEPYDPSDATFVASRPGAPPPGSSRPGAQDSTFEPPPSYPNNSSAYPPPAPAPYGAGNLQRIPPIDAGARRVDYQQPAPTPAYPPGAYVPR